MQAASVTWADEDLPACLDVSATGNLLGFAEHDIQILMAVGKLTPLGDPAPNASKLFAAVEMIRLAVDQAWLYRSTKESSEYRRHKRESRQAPAPSSHRDSPKSIIIKAEKVSPNSSPKVTPDGQFGGGNGAMPSVEKEVAKTACFPVKNS
jgi:hypothetical protein